MTETTAANPELLADQVAQLLVQPLEAATVVLSSAPRIFDTAGVLRIPKLVSGASVGFIGEGSLIPDDADVDFDEVTLMPTERKSIKTILRFTNESVRQPVLGIDAVLGPRHRITISSTRCLVAVTLTHRKSTTMAGRPPLRIGTTAGSPEPNSRIMFGLLVVVIAIATE